MSRTFLGILATLALVYAGMCVALFFLQRSMIYFPTRENPGAGKRSQTFSVQGADLKISIRPFPGAKALLYFGGNAEDVSVNLPDFSNTFPDHALYLLHSRRERLMSSDHVGSRTSANPT